MMPDAHVGSVLTLGGHWKIDSKYGRQFEVITFEETLPATVYGIEKYLGSGLIKGIGPKFAKLIVNQFGKDTLEVIETDPDRLLAVPSIGKKRVDNIKRGWPSRRKSKTSCFSSKNMMCPQRMQRGFTKLMARTASLW